LAEELVLLNVAEEAGSTLLPDLMRRKNEMKVNMLGVTRFDANWKWLQSLGSLEWKLMMRMDTVKLYLDALGADDDEGHSA
jgi:hypothetical protein